jgi:hypothetical protein
LGKFPHALGCSLANRQVGLISPVGGTGPDRWRHTPEQLHSLNDLKRVFMGLNTVASLAWLEANRLKFLHFRAENTRIVYGKPG